jgi:hypothetical protein
VLPPRCHDSETPVPVRVADVILGAAGVVPPRAAITGTSAGRE